MEADKGESKTKLLKVLAKEVNGIKKDVDEQKVKTDNIAEWVKNTFRPGMEKMKELIDQEANQLKERLDANEAYSKNITTWIKDNLGVNLEKIDEIINQKLTARLEQQDVDLKSREESLWKIFNVKYTTAVNQFEDYIKKVETEKLQMEAKFKLLQEDASKMHQERLKIEELKVQLEQTHNKLKEEAKNRPEETVNLLRNLAKKIDSEKKKLEEERTKLNNDLKYVKDEVSKEIKRLEERRLMESDRIKIEQEKLKVKHEREQLEIEEEWKRIQIAKRKLEQMNLQAQSIPQSLPVVDEPKKTPPQSRSATRKSEEVSDWLRENGFEAYIDKFLTNGYDTLHLVATLDQSDLNTMEITLPGHRKGLLAAASQLNK